MKKILSAVLSFILVFSLDACGQPSSKQDPSDAKYKTVEIMVDNNGMNIYGVAYVPQTDLERMPIAIFSHGIGGSYSTYHQYAEALAARGIATYSFDFCGGGGTRSDGATQDMSIMTEVSDLTAVFAAAKTWDFVDADKIVLIGGSQGGFVSAIVAARHVDEVAGVVLYYPAFFLVDYIHDSFDSPDEVEGTFDLGSLSAGRKYVEDIWDYGTYSEVGQYDKDVLIVHGDKDTVSDITYSKWALEVYPNAQLHIIEGAGHKFKGDQVKAAMDYTLDYLEEIHVLTSP